MEANTIKSVWTLLLCKTFNEIYMSYRDAQENNLFKKCGYTFPKMGVYWDAQIYLNTRLKNKIENNST